MNLDEYCSWSLGGVYIEKGNWKYRFLSWSWNKSIWDPDVRWAAKSAENILQWYTWSYHEKK
jgi:hypothetical protein